MSFAALLVGISGCSDFALEKVHEEPVDGLRALTATPSAVDFGVQPTSTAVSEVVTLTSTGDMPVTVSEVALGGSAAYATTWTGGELTLQPGETTDVVVTYTAASWQDEALLTVVSDAHEGARLLVPVTGAGVYPALVVEPSSVSFLTQNLVPVQEEVVVTSVGTADLVISSAYVDEPSFAATLQVPVTLAPGESAPFTVTYTPVDEGETVTGRLWLTTNTAEGYAVVPLDGHDAIPCVGLGEAWDRGLLDAQTLMDGVTLGVTDDDAEETVCVDTWYVWRASESQDLGAGDMAGDFGGAYPEGLVRIEAGEREEFDGGGWTGTAWYCLELDQYTQPLKSYQFTGARVPEPLLSFMLDGDQDSVWAWQEENPVMLAGRDTNYVEVGTGGGATVELRLFNMGSVAGTAEVRETVPAGWSATGFSPSPVRREAGDDGATVYVFEVSLDARDPGASWEDTDYDELVISYTLTSPACEGRQTLTPLETRWTDSSGQPRVATANPLIVNCLSATR